MKKTDWYDKFMILVGFLTSGTLLPHIYAMVQSQNSTGQSPYGAIGLIFCLICWLIYGYRHRLITMLFTNSFGILLASVYLITILYYKG